MARISWTPESVRAAANGFGNRRAFKLGNPKAYSAARRLGILDQVCANMRYVDRKLTHSILHEVAKNFSSRGEFFALDNSAYNAARRHGILDDICSHMEPMRRSLSKEYVSSVAKNFSNRREFMLRDGGAYRTARLNGWLEEVCVHMMRGVRGFNPTKSAVLYQVKFKLPLGMVVWKVGITNGEVRDRVNGFGIASGVSYEINKIYKYSLGSLARLEEKRLHNIGVVQGMCYDGVRFLKNGHTELFVAPLM